MSPGFHEDEVLGKAYDARLMRRLLRYLRPYASSVAIALGAITGTAVLQLAQPYLMKVAIDDHIAVDRLEGLGWIAVLYVGILLTAFALEYVQTFTMQMTGQRIMADLRSQVFGHLQRADVAFYDRNPVGRLMTRVTTDVDVLNELFTSGVVAGVGDVFTLLGIMVVLLVMNWRLACLTFLVLPLILLITRWFRGHVRESYRTVRIWIARINAFLQENITGMSTVQLFRREAEQFRRFDRVNARHRDAIVDSIFYYALFYPLVELVGALSAALIIWVGGGWTLEGTLTLGSLVAFLQYAQRFFRPISDMSEKFNIMQAAMASSERIFALLDTPARIVSPAAAGRLPPAPSAPAGLVPARGTRGCGRLAFEHVWFSYQASSGAAGADGTDGPTDHRAADLPAPDLPASDLPASAFVLRDVSFIIEPGQRVGIVGATGAGKTTLTSLLLRFYDVTRGRITLDGTDIRDVPLEELRAWFGLVLQDVHLFSGTIASNVRLGRTNIDDAAVRRAAQAVHADTFIEALPQGYETPVAERGSTLSVGQKQLLSFARALAFDPPILILDEATSSVDTETELLIRDALRVLMAERTTLAIAHRLSTIQDMDRILVFHRGQLREAGTHQELLTERGIYYRLFQLQYAGAQS